MFWLDAFEDPFKHPGTVWLFGKVTTGTNRTTSKIYNCNASVVVGCSDFHNRK
jgi:hypothetical protein